MNPDWRAAARATLATRVLDAAGESDLIEEIAQHLEAEFEALVAHGVDAESARDQVLSRLSDEQLLRAAKRRAPYREPHAPGRPTRGVLVESLWQDVRYGWRALARTPTVSTIAVLSFALTIGATTAVFGLFDTVLLEPLHVPHPEQLFLLERAFDVRHPGMGMPIARGTPLMSAASYDIVTAAPGLSRVQAMTSRSVDINTGSEAVPAAQLELVSPGFFRLLGVPLAIGRDFDARDVAAQAPVAIVSYDFWKRHLDGNPAAIGRVMHVKRAAVTVIGVAPRRYHGVGRGFDLAVPAAAAPTLGFPGGKMLGAQFLGRASDQQAAGGIANALGTALRECCAQNLDDGGSTTGPLVEAVSLRQGMPSNGFRDQYRRVIIVLMGGVVILLLLGCANVATLLVARGTAREPEFAVRASLGASRMRIARQLLVESFELTLCGTIAGLAIARVATQMLAHTLPAIGAAFADDLPIHPSAALLAFTTAVVVLCTVICGLLPALRLARRDLRVSLAGASSPTRGGPGVVVDRVLLTSQVALALVLVSTAMLFVATMRTFQEFDFGYKDSHELLAAFSATELMADSSAVVAFARRLSTAIDGIPGVDRSGLATETPLFAQSMNFAPVEIEGQPADPQGQVGAQTALITPGYLRATGIGLLRGRDFSAIDSTRDLPVVIVSASFVRKHFGARDPLGTRIRTWWPGAKQKTWLRIVGVTGDAYYPRLSGGMAKDVAAPTDMIYMPLSQTFAIGYQDKYLELQLVMHTIADPRAVENEFRRTVASIPGADLARLSSVSQVLNNSIPRERLAATLGTVFAIIALSLAAAGFFGVVAYAVVRRTREVGIRIALGARPTDTLWLMVRETLVVTVVGAAVGLGLGRLAAHAVRSQLYGISASDPRIPLAAALLLLLVGLIASALPARRATRVDPLIALRSE